MIALGLPIALPQPCPLSLSLCPPSCLSLLQTRAQLALLAFLLPCLLSPICLLSAATSGVLWNVNLIMCSLNQHLLTSCALLATIQMLKIPLNNFPSHVELRGNQAPLPASSSISTARFQPHQSPSQCLRAVLIHPFLDFAVPLQWKPFPALLVWRTPIHPVIPSYGAFL